MTGEYTVVTKITVGLGLEWKGYVVKYRADKNGYNQKTFHFEKGILGLVGGPQNIDPNAIKSLVG